jgi:DNA-binding LytR/AlgR family response regulator
MTVQIVLADDEVLARQTLRLLLKEEEDCEIAGEAVSDQRATSFGESRVSVAATGVTQPIAGIPLSGMALRLNQRPRRTLSPFVSPFCCFIPVDRSLSCFTK